MKVIVDLLDRYYREEGMEFSAALRRALEDADVSEEEKRKFRRKLGEVILGSYFREVSLAIPFTTKGENEMRQFELNLTGQVIRGTVSGQSAILSCSLPRETCPVCEQPFCNLDCSDSDESAEEVTRRIKYNAAHDAIEEIIVAHVCAGVNVESKEYVSGIQAALDKINYAYSIWFVEGV